MKRLEFAIVRMRSSRLLEMKLMNKTGKQVTTKESFREMGDGIGMIQLDKIKRILVGNSI
jgi:hypothetical protein